ncbi:MAG: LysR family transcriptional regulator [Oscillospiraceae bacterium]|nr:LysR family transcriptional regulator [Oscillospiraceae bacterium]
MDFQGFESFYTTVKYQSISKAAAVLHLTQPGLSQQLKNLENEMGAKLLVRSNKGVELTEEGKIVYNYACTILSIKDNIKKDLQSLQNSAVTLKIGSCKAVGEYALPCSIFIFKKTHDEVDIEVKLTSSSEVVQNLLDHTINVGIIQDSPDSEKIEALKIASDELILVGHPSGGKKAVSLAELREMPFIAMVKSSGSRRLLEKALQEKGLGVDKLRLIYSLDSYTAIRSSVLAGDGFSFLPQMIVRRELKEGTLEQISVEQLRIPFSYYVAIRKGYEMTEYERYFVDFIRSSRRGFC